MSDELIAAVCGAIAGGATSFFLQYLSTFSNRQQNLRDQISDEGFTLSGFVHAYWSASGINKSLEASIISSLNRLRNKLRLVGFNFLYDEDVRNKYRKIFETTTGGQFAVAGRKPSNTVGHSADQLMHELFDVVNSKRTGWIRVWWRRAVKRGG